MILFIISLVQHFVHADAVPLYNKTLDKLSSSDQRDIASPEIKTGYYPSHMIIDDYSSTLYVANEGSNTANTISVISTENNTKIKDIPVGKSPRNMIMDIFAHTLYVANMDSNTVSVISTENNTKIKDIPVGNSPFYMDMDMNANTLYVAYTGGNISVISTENNTKIKDIPVGKSPMGQMVNMIIDKYGQTLYLAIAGSNNISMISTKSNTWIKDIPVGELPWTWPSYMIIDYSSNKLYVLRYGNISGISTEYNTKIKDIPVGGLFSYLTPGVGTLYISNFYGDNVSVISTKNYARMKDIPTGKNPSHMIIDNYSSTLYVANEGSNTISVISTENNTKIKDIPVGKSPGNMIMDIFAHTLYVANRDSGGVSVVDTITNKAVAGVTFQVNPHNSGTIICGNNLHPTTNSYLFVYSNTQCTAKPDIGFEFSNWIKNIGHNSTRTLKTSYTTTNLYDSFLSLFGQVPENKEAILNITEFGNFTANFRKASPPIPTEYLIGLYTIVASTIVGYSVPSIIGWYKSKKQSRIVSGYHKQIKELYNDNMIDARDIKELNELNDDVDIDYSKGKVSDKQYENMKSEIGTLYEEVYNKKINSITNFTDNQPTNDDRILLDGVKNEISKAYRNGKIDNEQNENMKNEISVRYREIFKNKIDSLNKESDHKRAELSSNILNEMKDAFANGKLNGTHYYLLKEALLEKKI